LKRLLTVWYEQQWEGLGKNSISRLQDRNAREAEDLSRAHLILSLWRNLSTMLSEIRELQGRKCVIRHDLLEHPRDPSF
jgi:hypothetical protein